MLRRIRIALAALCLSGLCLLFLEPEHAARLSLGALARMQLVPALLAGSLLTVAALAVLTLLCGRVYCSVVCPLGVLQDLISHCHPKRRYHAAPARTAIRLAALLAFILAFAAGVPLLFGLLEPYSAFGRMLAGLGVPLWQTGNNLLALGAARMDSVAFVAVPVWQKGLSALAAAGLTLTVIGFWAWKQGRGWCNTLCPVGTVLGFLSRFALLQIRLDPARCVQCGKCAAQCKAACLDVTRQRVDASRCVACFDCLEACPKGGLRLAPVWQRGGAAPPRAVASVASRVTTGKPGAVLPIPATSTSTAAAPRSAASRRAFLLALPAALGLPGLARAKDAIPALTRKQRPARAMPITPPGSLGLAAFRARCTGCQLCVAACPHQALRATDTGQGMLQPALSFEHGYCRVNCVACSTVCPTGAIRPMTPARKSATQIGYAVIRPEVCIIATDQVPCTACSRNCPAGAVLLVGEKRLPAVDTERCTGCGACEYTCPARPYSAIQVEGVLVHRLI